MYTCIDPTSIIPTKFDVDMIIHCKVSVLSDDTLRDLVTLTKTYSKFSFDLKQLSHMAGHVTNPATKFETSTPMHS